MVKFHKIMAALLISGMLALGQFSFADSGVSGLMMVVKGDITVIGADGKSEKAKVGKKVFPGDTIVAGPDSRAKIVMTDKNTLNVSPDSKVVIEKYENNPAKDERNVSLNVVYGKVRATVEQKYDGDKNKFNVKTPSAVAGVRGTDFLTSYDRGSQQSKVVTFGGVVAVGKPGPGGKIEAPVFVRPGQMTTASAGAAPAAPAPVPKEELNSMNNDTRADAAPAKQEQQQEQKSEEKKDEAKEEPKAEEQKEASKEEPKADEKQEAKEEPKQEDKKEAKKDEAKADEKQAKKDNSKSDEKQAKNKNEPGQKKMGDKPRDPASQDSGGCMMCGAGDIGGGPGEKDKQIILPPPPPPPVPQYIPTEKKRHEINQVYNPILDNIIKNTRSRVYITIQPQ